MESLIAHNYQFLIAYGLFCYLLGVITSRYMGELFGFLRSVVSTWSQKEMKMAMGLISFFILVGIEATNGTVSIYAWGVPFFLIGINPGDFFNKKK